MSSGQLASYNKAKLVQASILPVSLTWNLVYIFVDVILRLALLTGPWLLAQVISLGEIFYSLRYILRIKLN